MISEEMIKNAVAEADQAIRDSLPAPAECEHEFSPLFQRKMCQAFRMVKHPGKEVSVSKLGKHLLLEILPLVAQQRCRGEKPIN